VLPEEDISDIDIAMIAGATRTWLQLFRRDRADIASAAFTKPGLNSGHIENFRKN
jgi:hypothetical protein